MKRRDLFLYFGVVLLIFYLFNLNQIFVKFVNLTQIDKTEFRKRVEDYKNKLLEVKDDIKEKDFLLYDRETLRLLQKAFGINANLKGLSEKIPSTFFASKIYSKKSMKQFQKEPIFEIVIDSNLRVSYLFIPKVKDQNLKDVKNEIQFLIEALSIKKENLQNFNEGDDYLEVPQLKGEEETEPSGEISYFENIEGVPLTGYLHKFSIDEKGIKYKRSLLFKKALFNEEKAIFKDIILFLLWLIFVLFAFLTLILKIKRDEVDWKLISLGTLFISTISFIYVSFSEVLNLLTVVVIIITSFLTGLIYSLLFNIALSKTRDGFEKQLLNFNALFSFNFNVKENGFMILKTFLVGNFFFALPLSYYYFFKLFEKGGVVILPPDCFTIKSTSIFSYTFGNLVESLSQSFYFILIFGIFIPSLLSRRNNLFIRLTISILFSLIASFSLSFEPYYLSFLIVFVLTFLVFHIWNEYGFIGVFLSFSFPLIIQRGAMLLFSKDAQIAVEGGILLLIVIFILFTSFYWIVKGKPISEIKPYEPLYIKRIKEKERLERELEIAKSLHQRLLPKETPILKNIEIATFCEPAMEVGGDYYDFIELDESKVLMFLGDVSGKGIRAAFYMTLAKGLLHGALSLVKDVKDLLRLLNRRFGRLSEEGIFLTLIALMIDEETNEITITSAGHNPPLLYRDGKVEVVKVKGLVIGPLPDEVVISNLIEYKFRMKKGDVLLLYTDGVTESFNPKFEEYGVKNLEANLLNSHHKSPPEIIYDIRSSVLEFTENAPLRDDFTMVVLKGKDG